MKIEIQSNAQFRKALRRFAPDLDRTLKQEMAKALRPVVKQAKGFVPSSSPLSGWARFSALQRSGHRGGL